MNTNLGINSFTECLIILNYVCDCFNEKLLNFYFYITIMYIFIYCNNSYIVLNLALKKQFTIIQINTFRSLSFFIVA